jgi:predicted DNA-binding transcriptional regulator
LSKDTLYGWLITLIFLVLLILYTVLVAVPITMLLLDNAASVPFDISPEMTQFFLMVPVYLGVLLFSIIVMWIGYTMATTPPPEPIDLDSLDLDDDDDEEESSNDD